MKILRVAAPLALAGGLVLGTAAATVAQGNQVKGDALPCSIKVARDRNASGLRGMARISATQALSAAQAAGAGVLGKTSLEDENGCVVYAVQKTSVDGKRYEVLIDAGNARVLKQAPVVTQDRENENASEDLENPSAAASAELNAEPDWTGIERLILTGGL